MSAIASARTGQQQKLKTTRGVGHTVLSSAALTAQSLRVEHGVDAGFGAATGARASEWLPLGGGGVRARLGPGEGAGGLSAKLQPRQTEITMKQRRGCAPVATNVLVAAVGSRHASYRVKFERQNHGHETAHFLPECCRGVAKTGVFARRVWTRGAVFFQGSSQPNSGIGRGFVWILKDTNTQILAQTNKKEHTNDKLQLKQTTIEANRQHQPRKESSNKTTSKDI